MKKFSGHVAAAVLAIVAVEARAEQGFYGGAGLSYGSADSFDNHFVMQRA